MNELERFQYWRFLQFGFEDDQAEALARAGYGLCLVDASALLGGAA